MPTADISLIRFGSRGFADGMPSNTVTLGIDITKNRGDFPNCRPRTFRQNSTKEDYDYV